MKYRTKLHYRCLSQLGELTDIVTIFAIIGDILIVSFEESLTIRIIGITLLTVALIIACFVYKQYHKKRLERQKKESLKLKRIMIEHRKRLVKHINKHPDKHFIH